MARAGFLVSLICPHEKSITIDGVRIIPLGKPRSRLFRFLILPWWITALALREKGDIYHFHDPDLLLAGLCLRVLFRKRVIYDVHENVPQALLTRPWIPAWARAVVSSTVGWGEVVAARTFDAVVTATPELMKRFAGCRRIADVRNYPKLNRSETSSGSERVQGETTLIYVGGLEEVRGVREMIQAVGLLGPGAKLELVGEFTEPDFAAEMLRLEAWPQVRHVGVIPHEEIPDRLGRAEIGLVCLQPLPRFKVSYPIKLFEYMAAGIPVVASDFPLWRSIIEQAGCGILVDPLDPADIASAVQEILDHPHRAKVMGANGRLYAESRCNWVSEETKLLALYREVLSPG